MTIPKMERQGNEAKVGFAGSAIDPIVLGKGNEYPQVCRNCGYVDGEHARGGRGCEEFEATEPYDDRESWEARYGQ